MCVEYWAMPYLLTYSPTTAVEGEGVSGHETAHQGEPECALTVPWDDERYQAALFTSLHPPTCIPSNGNPVKLREHTAYQLPGSSTCSLARHRT